MFSGIAALFIRYPSHYAFPDSSWTNKPPRPQKMLSINHTKTQESQRESQGVSLRIILIHIKASAEYKDQLPLLVRKTLQNAEQSEENIIDPMDSCRIDERGRKVRAKQV